MSVPDGITEWSINLSPERIAFLKRCRQRWILNIVDCEGVDAARASYGIADVEHALRAAGIGCGNPRHDHTLDAFEVCGGEATPCTDGFGLTPDGYEPPPPCGGTGTVDMGAGGTDACPGCRDCAREG